MESSSLVLVFLAVIALASVMQAAFVAALAVFLRKGGRKVEALEDTMASEVLPRLGQISKAAGKAAELSGDAVRQAHRMDVVVGEAALRMERAVDRASRRIEHLVEDTGDRLAAGASRRASRGRVGRALRRAGAFALGVQKAMAVFEQLGPTNGHGRGRPPEGDDDPDLDEDDPAVPSPD
jgi:hypothetical protein